MSNPWTLKHLEAMFGSLANCCLHQPAWTPADARKVICSVQSNYDSDGNWKDSNVFEPERWPSWKDGSESESYTVVRLRDGSYGLLSESEDYTGHGCQCGASATVHATKEDLLRFGVDNTDAREAIDKRLKRYK